MNTDEIVNFFGPRVLKSPVEGFGVEVSFRELTGARRRHWVQQFSGMGPATTPLDSLSMQEAFIADTLCDDGGALVQGATPVLQDLAASALDALFKAALRANGMQKDAVKDARGN
jgi:hypothetical protein